MKLDEKNCVVKFKSLPEFFRRECSGTKANTLRVVTQEEYNGISRTLPERILITNVVTGESFEREISSVVMVPQSVDITIAPGMVLIIISWWSS